MVRYDVIVVGGGLAGLTSALHLAKKGQSVLLIEQHAYPRHKVCGEYISNEVLPYWGALGVDPFEYGAKKIDRFTLSTPRGQSLTTKLPLGGFGISRYRIDWELVKKAKKAGAVVVQAKVVDIQFENDQFEVLTNQNQSYMADFVIGAFGKRSNLDVKMNRAFMKEATPFLGVKAHYKGTINEDMVGLHNFEGGYCGLSKVETDLVNVCYITNYQSFKRYKNIVDFQREVLSKNKYLKEVFDTYELAFEEPLSIAQISFSSKQPVEHHIFMCGDSAGMIHPLAGNGMSMAIKAAQLACQQILQFNSNSSTSRTVLEEQYTKLWNKEFKGRLKSGHLIAGVFNLGLSSELLMLFLRAFPFILPYIIRKTHGKSMRAEL